MAVKNGAAYVEEQVGSILCQLSTKDELIVSDDHSTDSTLDIVNNFQDSRIKVFSSPRHGLVHNFEHALSRSAGDFIFLADQDDVWHPEKLDTMMPYLANYDLVVCDCRLVSPKLDVLNDSFFELNRSGKGFVRNLISNSYMGCCMGFHRRILQRALPFPGNSVIHDFWIGMIAETHYSSLFLKKPLVNHRLHASNASTAGRRSRTSPINRMTQRYQLVRNLISRSL
ncbi:MAG TPA: glycosyltransferase [Cyclobacteriaceae bacterium]|nr:glycosyltransferase [Cyclobacteriaceae bacterium]